MDYAIETLQQAANRVKGNLRLMEKRVAHDLETAEEFEAMSNSAPGIHLESQYVNAARGCRNSAAWTQGRAIPAELQKLTELEAALAILQNREKKEAA